MKLRNIIIPLSAVSGAYLFSISPGMRRHPDTDRLKGFLFAHRGLHDNSAGIPENSLAAFRKAADEGYGIELDVQLTEDGIPVILHDFYLKRMVRDKDGNAPEGKVRDYTLAGLKEFHILDTEEKIPEFREVLETVAGRVPLIVEYKAEDTDMSVCVKGNELLSGYEGLYCVESFNPYAVYWYRRNRPDIIRGQLSERYLKEPKYRKPLYFAMENLMLNFLTRPDFIAYDRKGAGNLSRRICRKLYGNTAVGWTIRDQEQYEDAKKQYDIIIFDSFLPEVQK